MEGEDGGGRWREKMEGEKMLLIKSRQPGHTCGCLANLTAFVPEARVAAMPHTEASAPGSVFVGGRNICM